LALFACLILAFGCESLASGSSGVSNADTVDRSQTRVAHFPKGASIGPLLLISHVTGSPDSWHFYTIEKQVGGATGTVNLTVPPQCALMLDANRRVAEDPSLLKQVSGIDAIRLKFVSMEERENDICDKALAYTKYIKGLRLILINQSEATDNGLSQLTDMPDLRVINGSNSGVKGASFKVLANLPSLRELSFKGCHIDQANLVYLSRCPKLEILNLGKTQLGLPGAKFLSKCTGLTELSLYGNSKFDDSCLICLAPLRKLRVLTLFDDTAITIKGLTALRGIKLRQLGLPRGELERHTVEIKSMFPNAEIVYPNKSVRNVDREDQILFAPLH
jgi:hypothetical protein